jgi:hypothetical protein
MPLELQIIRAAEFIRIGAEGHFDLAASKQALAKLARACRKRGIDRALLDLRALRPGPKPVFSPADLAAMVDTFREIGFTRELRLAVLYHSDPHRRARLFSLLGIMRGWSVRAFGDYEQAILWLSEEPAEGVPSPRSASAKSVPVKAAPPESSALFLPVKHARPERVRVAKAARH